MRADNLGLITNMWHVCGFCVLNLLEECDKWLQ